MRGLGQWLERLAAWVTVLLAGVLFVGALVVMAGLAGWRTLVDQLRPTVSFWFAVAFAAELVAFGAYVFAYRAVAHIEGGPRIGWLEAACVVAVGFGAFPEPERPRRAA
jgi:hypothetical protein